MNPAAPSANTLGQILHRTARRSPSSTALRCGEISWTYAELDSRVRRASAGLARLGIGKGDRVAVLSLNSQDFVVVRFAIARLGAVVVPVNFMLRPHEIAYILQHSEAKLLFVDGGFAETACAAMALGTAVETLVWLAGEASTSPPEGMLTLDQLLETDDGSEPPVDSRDLAQIIYTSGTEALPKGAMLSHESVITQYWSCIVDAEIHTGDTMLHALPLYHCAQLDCFLGPGIYVGAVNVITNRPSPDNLLRLLAQHRITSFFAPPTVWISLLRSSGFDRADLSALRKAYYGASIMPVEVLREMQRRLPQLRLWNLYGQTEMAPLATVLKPRDQLRKPGSAGRPCIHVETRVIDEAGIDVAPGVVGEVVHRSPHLFAGYWRDAECTAAAFEGGWFHSGDLATIDEEGYLTIVDRKKDMIKTGGENVSSREVEEVVYRLPQVAEVAVIGLPHPRWIEAVSAVVVLRDGHALTGDIVIAHCREHLAHFKVPKVVVFAAELPKNPSGKVLKRELRVAHAAAASAGTSA